MGPDTCVQFQTADLAQTDGGEVVAVIGKGRCGEDQICLFAEIGEVFTGESTAVDITSSGEVELLGGFGVVSHVF